MNAINKVLKKALKFHSKLNLILKTFSYYYFFCAFTSKRISNIIDFFLFLKQYAYLVTHLF